jgi:lipopolysaccharide/colanic/teichoic acid biosynthesis glycosyltransferase
VRFGNVLGSDGSVIPLFQRQLKRGGPITVTHPEARRYFMTIPEAARLVLQAGAMGRGGEVLLLDMGEQVRILDLARQLVRMAGLREGEDIEIVFTGLRPGEKLYEELHSDAERTRITRHERILVWDLDARDEESLMAEVAELEARALDGTAEIIKDQLRQIVPEYSEPRHDPMEPAPATPVVELPAALPLRPHAPMPGWSERTRRLVEAAVAAVLLALSLPLWLALWLDARRTSRGEMLIRETRIGRTRRRYQRRSAGTEITIDRRSIERRTQDLLGTPIRCVRFRTDVGPVSRWAHRHRLDRLPFLLNVVRCDMALVGPAPETEERVLRWKDLIPEYDRRFTVLPGVTGLAQLRGGPGTDAESMALRTQYDLYYVDHRAPLLDVRVLMRTLVAVVQPSKEYGARSAAAPAAPPIRGVAFGATSGMAARQSGSLPAASPPAVKGATR